MSEQLLTWDYPKTKTALVEYGTQLRLYYMWGYKKSGGPGPHKDIRYTVTTESMTLEQCIDEMYKLYEAHCAKHNCEPRHHFIEGYKVDEFGDVDILTGT